MFFIKTLIGFGLAHEVGTDVAPAPGRLSMLTG